LTALRSLYIAKARLHNRCLRWGC